MARPSAFRADDLELKDPSLLSFLISMDARTVTKSSTVMIEQRSNSAKYHSCNDFDQSVMRWFFRAKTPLVLLFRAFHRARVGRPNELLTAKKMRLLFKFSIGWSFSQEQA
jgi:hypothetical protein